jgi:type IV pilus assembly protein PilB
MQATFQDRTFNEVLITEGLITQRDLARLLGEREDATEPVGDMLVRLGILTEKDRARCAGKQMGVPFVDLAQRELDGDVARLIPHPMALRMKALPIERSETAVSVAMANPLDITAIDAIQAQTGLQIDPVIATEEDIREAIGRLFGSSDDLGELIGEAMRTVDPKEEGAVGGDDGGDDVRRSDVSVRQLRQMSEGAPVIRLVSALITRAVASRASDIHIGPEKNRVRVRYRVDGLLQEATVLPRRLQFPLISRLKILANMDIAEHRAPQDGRMSLVIGQSEYDFRVSTYPSLFGENVVIRILDKNAGRITLPSIGMAPDLLARLRELINRPYGMFIVCGPTGSGKTTTLYACLNALNTVDRNIMTIEDPVEYQLAGIVQGSVNPKAGITFASGLRTLVRQDPDVILVGEIRDTETARIALEAALTGHLVLSTLHANDAAGALTRLVDLGVEPFLVASAVVATLAQRLVRVTCPKCAAPYLPDRALLEEIGGRDLLAIPGFGFTKGAGCETCNRAGYKGRTGIHELMEMTRDVQQLVLAQASTQEIRTVALAGKRTLREDALLKVAQNQTTPEEVARMTVA